MVKVATAKRDSLNEHMAEMAGSWLMSRTTRSGWMAQVVEFQKPGRVAFPNVEFHFR